MLLIDPATAKIIAQIVQQILTDEETRKRIFYIIAIPIVMVVILISMFQYMVTQPFDALADMLGDDAPIAEEFLNEYGSEFGDENNFWLNNEYILNADYEIGDYSQYDAFDTEMFNKLMTEATKFVGRPYVWGGSTPQTSFDCSGFICWSYTASGVYNLPRTTAQGIFNQCVPIPKEEAKAGDLIFFTKTYETSNPVTHIAIYLGNGKMLHAGNPIGYADTNTAYWNQHFYATARLPIVAETKEIIP